MRKPNGAYVVTGHWLGWRLYAGEQPGRVSTDPADAKVWYSLRAAGRAANALSQRTGEKWTVIPEEKR